MSMWVAVATVAGVRIPEIRVIQAMVRVWAHTYLECIPMLRG